MNSSFHIQIKQSKRLEYIEFGNSYYLIDLFHIFIVHISVLFLIACGVKVECIRLFFPHFTKHLLY